MSTSAGEDCLDALRAHFDDLAAGASPLSDVKLMLLGNGRAGKTQLSNKLRDIPFNPDWDSTHGIVVADAKLQVADDETPTILHIWDFGGQDI
jgi:internalin A